MRDRLDAPVLVGVGAAFDFHAGLKPQAPDGLQRLGLEWAFRLAQEPRRLWRRYLRYNPRFVLGFARQYARHLRRGVVRAAWRPRRGARARGRARRAPTCSTTTSPARRAARATWSCVGRGADGAI